VKGGLGEHTADWSDPAMVVFSAEQLAAIASLSKVVAKSFLSQPRCMVGTAFGSAALAGASARNLSITFASHTLTVTAKLTRVQHKEQYHLSMRKQDIDTLQLQPGDVVCYSHVPHASRLEFTATVTRQHVGSRAPPERRRLLRAAASASHQAAEASDDALRGDRFEEENTAVDVLPATVDVVPSAGPASDPRQRLQQGLQQGLLQFSKTVTSHLLKSARMKLPALIGQQICGDEESVPLTLRVSAEGLGYSAATRGGCATDVSVWREWMSRPAQGTSTSKPTLVYRLGSMATAQQLAAIHNAARENRAAPVPQSINLRPVPCAGTTWHFTGAI
jgi:hypothetical protein